VLTTPVLILAQMEHMLMTKEIANNVQPVAHHAKVLMFAILATITLLFQTIHACVNLTMKSLLDLTSITSKSISSILNGTIMQLKLMLLQDSDSTVPISSISTIAQATSST
jgi:hypothetical protein